MHMHRFWPIPDNRPRRSPKIASLHRSMLPNEGDEAPSHAEGDEGDEAPSGHEWTTSICAVIRFWATSGAWTGSGPESVHTHILVPPCSSA